MCAKKAIIVFRHGQKGFKDSDLVPDACEGIKASVKDNPHPCYFDEVLKNPVTGEEIKDLYYSDLSYTGYREGKSFAVTVPTLIKDFEHITRAIVLHPDVNGNTYITTYPFLKQLHAQGSLKTLEFYRHTGDIKHITPQDDDGSILITGTADTLYDDDNSIIKQLNANDDYPGKADKPQRGRDIYVYSHEGLKTCTQNPDNQTTGPLNREKKPKPPTCIKC